MRKISAIQQLWSRSRSESASSSADIEGEGGITMRRRGLKDEKSKERLDEIGRVQQHTSERDWAPMRGMGTEWID
jgi:hypothetical protein